MSTLTSRALPKNDPLIRNGISCPYCGFPFQYNDQVVVCNVDATPHHVDCWNENGNHCATLGCEGAGEVAAPVRVSTRGTPVTLSAAAAAPRSSFTPFAIGGLGMFSLILLLILVLLLTGVISLRLAPNQPVQIGLNLDGATFTPTVTLTSTPVPFSTVIPPSVTPFSFSSSEPPTNTPILPTHVEPSLTPIPLVDTLTTEPTETPFPTDTPTRTQIPTDIATRTRMPTETFTSTSTPLRPPNCAIAVDGRFFNLWSDSAIYMRLGCPRNAGHTSFSAEEAFEGGSMLWRQDKDQIYAIFNNGAWQGFVDTFVEGDPQFECGQASSPPSPQRGFSQVWCRHGEVRANLGNAIETEIGFCMQGGGPCDVFQDFDGGFMFYSQRFRAVYALFNDGTWRR